jgi:hypothetical protein
MTNDEIRMTKQVLTSRAACLAVFVIAFFITIIATCQANTLAMLSVLAFDGVCAFLWIGCACVLGCSLLGFFRFRAHPLLMIATGGGIGLGIFSLLGLCLGLAGVLNRPVAMLLPIGSVLLGIIVLIRRMGHDKQIDASPLRAWLAKPAGFSWLWIIPVIAFAMVCVSASILPGVLWKPFDPAPYDVTSYHLQVPREWYEAGRIVPLHHNMFSYFPFNVEMQFLLLMHVMGGPWVAMYACQYVCAGYYLLFVLAVAGAVADKGEPRTSNLEPRTSKEREKNLTQSKKPLASNEDVSSLQRSVFDVRCSLYAFPGPVIGASIAAVVPWSMMLAGTGYVESALMLYTALAIAWAMMSIPNSARTEPSGSAAGPSPSPFIKPLILTGILAGFAAGVKITAIPMLLIVLPTAVFFVVMFRRPAELPVRRLLIGCAVCVIAGSVVVSPWLIRNFIWAGNPIWPLAMNMLGRDHFSPEQVHRFITAHSPRPDQHSVGAHLGVFWTDVLKHWQYGYVLLPAGLLALLVRLKDRQTWLLLITGLSVFVVWIGFTHLLARFLVMLIPIAGIAIGRVRWGKLWTAGVVLLLVATGLSWVNFVPELLKQSNVPRDQSLFGLVDLSGFLSQEISEARQKQMDVGLVGDAQAFLYQIPMSRLHYSTVFDLPADASDPVEAWAGKDAVHNTNYWLVVNTSEIERLNRTYERVPLLPAKWAGQYPHTFFVREQK